MRSRLFAWLIMSKFLASVLRNGHRIPFRAESHLVSQCPTFKMGGGQ